MPEPLKYKLEKSITGWLAKSGGTGLTGFTYYEGQCPQQATLPFIGVTITEIRESFPDSSPKDCRVEVQILGAVDTDQDADGISGESTDRATNWTAHRAAVAAVESAMTDLQGFQQYAGKHNETDRPVSDFYVYDVQEDLQHSTAPGASRMFLSTITYTVVCEAHDN